MKKGFFCVLKVLKSSEDVKQWFDDYKAGASFHLQTSIKPISFIVRSSCSTKALLCNFISLRRLGLKKCECSIVCVTEVYLVSVAGGGGVC